MSTAQFTGMTREQAERFMDGIGRQPVRQRLADLVGGREVVDLGCGKADEVGDVFTREQYTGVDCSAELVALARERLPGWRFVVADASRIGGHWPVGIIKSVLEHLPSDEAVRLYDHARSITDVLYVAWHTEPGKEHLATYEGELGRMVQNRHDRRLFDGVVAREECPPHMIWTCV